MNHSEAMELAMLLNTDPEEAFANSYRSAMEALTTYEAQITMESSLDGLIDSDEFDDYDYDAATEAVTEKVSGYLKKLASWFKKLFMKFTAMCRGITFRSAEKSFEKTYGDQNSKMAKGLAAKKVVTGVGSIMKEWNKLGMPNGPTGDTVSASDMARMTKEVIKKGSDINKNLQEALRDPTKMADDLKDLNDKAKTAASLMKKMTSMLNAAAKKGMISMKKSGEAIKMYNKAKTMLND